MNFRKLKYLSLVWLFTLCCCKAPASVQKESQTSPLQSLVESKLGANANIEKNISNTFALAYIAENRSISYIVIRLSDLKIVVNSKIERGSITWFKDMELKETRTPGIVKKNTKPDDNIKLIDLAQFVVQKR